MATYDLGTARGVIQIDYQGNGPAQAQQQLGATGTAAGRASSEMDKAGKRAGVAGLVIAGGFALGVKSAADFEQRLSAIQAVSGATGSEMDQLRGKALQLGKDTAFSAGESAQAMEELIKAGLSVSDVLNGAADATVALAAAGGVDMATAATIASNAMNQFGLSAKDMSGVVDNIAGAANASAIDVNEFGMSLSQVGAVANLAGVNFKDTATAIALMGNAGIKGSDAGTSLKSMFQRLQPTTQKQFNTMKDLGLITADLSRANAFLQKEGLGTANTFDGATKKFQKYAEELGKGKVGTVKNAQAAQDLMLQYGGLTNQFYDAEGKTKSLAKVSEVLKQSLKGMSQEQKQAALNTLFGSDAIRGAAILANNGAKGFDKMATSMGKVKAADVAKTRMDNLKGSFEAFTGSLETLGITVGTLLLPTLRSIVDGLNGLVSAFLSLPSGVQTGIVAFVGLVGAALLMLALFVKITKGIQEVRLAYAAARSTALGFWLASLGPIALVVAAIAIVIAILVVLWKKSETFRSIVTGAWEAIKSAVEAVGQWFAGPFVDFFVGAYNKVMAGLSAVGSFFTSVWNGIKAVVSAVVGAIAAVIIGGINLIKTVIGAGLAVVSAIWHAYWGTFGGVITAMFNLVVAVVRLGWTIIKGLFLLGLMGALAITKTVWNAIAAVVSAVWGRIRAVVAAGVAVVRAVVSAAWGVIRGVTSSVWSAISGVISAVWGRIRGVVAAGVAVVRAAVGAAWGAVSSVTSRIWNGLAGIVSSAVGRVIDIAAGIQGRVVGALAGAGRWLYDKGREIIQGLLDGIESMINAVADKINSVTDKIGRFLPGSPVREGPLKVLNRGHSGKEIVKMVIGGISSMEGELARTMSNLTSVPAPALTADLGRVGRSAALGPTPVLVGAPAGRSGRSGGDSAGGRSRLVEGRLTIDRAGRAWISGVAQDVVDSERHYDGVRHRMRGGN